MPASRRPALYRDEFDRLILEPYVFQEGRIVFDEASAPAAEAFWEEAIKPLSNYASIAVLASVIGMVAVVLTKSVVALLATQLFVIAAVAVLILRTYRLKSWLANRPPGS